MKKIITTLIFISTIGYMTAQISLPPNRCFTYDAAGNRIKRENCGNGSSSSLVANDDGIIKQKETIEKETISENR